MCPSTEMMVVEPAHDNSAKVETKESSLEGSDNTRKWPEEREVNSLFSRISHAYSCWTFSYMGSILLQGSERAKTDSTIEKITQNDLYMTPTTMQSSFLTSQFKKYFFAVDTDEIVISTKWKLLRTLWRLAAPTFIPAGFCQLITVLCQIAIPLLVRELLNILEETPGEKVIEKGMPCEFSCMPTSIIICSITSNIKFMFLLFMWIIRFFGKRCDWYICRSMFECVWESSAATLSIEKWYNNPCSDCEHLI